MGQKLGTVLPFLWGGDLGVTPFGGNWAPSNTVAWAEAYLRTKWHLDRSSRFATIDMGQNLGGELCPPPFLGGGVSWVPI